MRRPLFQLGPRLFKLLQDLRPSRRYAACERMLRRIGQLCVDDLLDGEITERDLRELDDMSDWRVTRGYIDLLLSCGVLEATGWGTFAIAFYLDSNLPADVRAKKNAEAKIKERDAQRARRQRQVGEPPIKTSTKTGILPSCQPSIDLTGVQGSENLTNKSPAGTDLRAKIVPAEKSVVSEKTEPMDFDAVVKRIAAKQGVDMGGTAKPTQVETPTPPAPMRPMTAARRPRERSPVNLGTAARALTDLDLDPTQDEPLFAQLYRMGAEDDEVGYAVWNIRRQQDKGRRVAHPIPYMLRIIENQRRYRGGSV